MSISGVPMSQGNSLLEFLKEETNISRATVCVKENSLIIYLLNRHLLSARYMEIVKVVIKKDIIFHSSFSRGAYFVVKISNLTF